MSNNMELYNRVKSVPKNAQRPISGGRLKGMTDINPMWRIEKLTEEFGPCGIGWYYDILERWIETSMSSDEITANMKINLFYKDNQSGEWSKPVQGIGGSMFVSKEKNGIYTNDECYKMALTDAISVACKALGVGADIYYGKENTKYNDVKKDNQENIKEKIKDREEWRNKVLSLALSKGIDAKELSKDYGLVKTTPIERLKEVYNDLLDEDKGAEK